MTTRIIGKGLFSCLAICLLIACGTSGQAEATLQPEEVKTSPPEQSGSAWVQTLSAGYFYTCRVKSDGLVDCWGYNANGQTTPPGGTFTQVSAGYEHTCGVKSDGTVACWGNDNDGRTTPPAGTFTQVSAGSSHTCGLKSDGTLVCWGKGQYGEATPPAGTFIQVSTSNLHTCGVKSDGTLACWGEGTYGQSTPPSGTFTQVSAGYSHTCGVKSDGMLACWGVNDDGQATPPEGTFMQVSAGNGHTCGVKSDGTVACWGLNDDSRATPPAGTFTQVSAGGTHTCGVKSDGTIICWGDNTSNQSSPYTMPYTISGNTGMWGTTLSYNDGSFKTVTSGGGDYSISVPYNWSGTVTPSRAGYTFTPSNREYVNVTSDQVNQDYTAQEEPTSQPEVDGFSLPEQSGSAWVETLSAGFSHTCRVKGDGTVDCWGNDFNGQTTPPAGTFTQVSAGYIHTCGVKSNGTVDCWGNSDDGQSTPPSGTFTQVSAGEVHNCGVKIDGTIICWGNDYYGQSTPPAGTFIQISAGGHNTCGVKNDGTITCWGYNDSGQATPPAGTFTQVSAGGTHTCGVKSDGTLACWGFNQYGQAAPPAGTFTQVSAGYEHTCGVKSDGTVACWGFNDDGQSTPPGGTFIQVSAGNTHTCGMMSNGSIVCWGDNTESQSSPYTIYGNAGAYWATLSYNDGSLKAVTSDGGADYSISVPYNWSGTVTPSREGYTITPLNREYVNVTADQINQDYTAYKSYADVLPYDSIPGDGCSFALFAYIETLHDAGFTAGCLTDPPRYCPNNTMTRAEAAVFMLRGNSGTGYTPPDAPWDTFADDWSPGPWAEKWAEGMWQEGMTAGCMADPLRFCPWDQFTRLEAAVLGLRLKYGVDYTPPPASGDVFTDMTDINYWGTKWAEQAFLDGLLISCGPCGMSSEKPAFCPNDPLTRAWGAYLIVEAKDLPLIIP